MWSAVLVGNSSSGIIESASLGVSAVNVGPRQTGRLKCGPGVLDCGETEPAIVRTIRCAMKRRRPSSSRSVYGDGRAGERIARACERLITRPPHRPKRLSY
jgi:UDP-N-acetylglucosamine 2-epimerase